MLRCRRAGRYASPPALGPHTLWREAATPSAQAATSRVAGVLVALSIKYTDSILKTIATTGSIALA